MLKDERTEIFIGRNQRGNVPDRERQDFFIGDAGGEFSHVPYLMTIGPQSPNNGGIDAFIGNQIHAADISTG